MILELDKEDLIALVKGRPPHLNLLNHFLFKDCLSYSDQYGTYSWNDAYLNKLSEEVLIDMYTRAKTSWHI